MKNEDEVDDRVWERQYSARCQLDNMGTHTHTYITIQPSDKA